MNESMMVDHWVRYWAQRQPDKPALICGDRVISYADLERGADTSARWICSLGVSKGDRIAVLLRNCPEIVELYLACAQVGVVFVPLNHRSTEKEMTYLLKDSAAAALVADWEFHSVLGGNDIASAVHDVKVVWLGKPEGEPGRDYHAELEALSGEKFMPDAGDVTRDSEDAQILMYTSGTTGNPKGALLSHRKTFFNSLNAVSFLELSRYDVMLIVQPLFHSGGLLIQLSSSLHAGLTVVLSRRFSAKTFFIDVARYGVTKFVGVPTIYRLLLAVPPGEREGLSLLKVCGIGGEKSTPSLIEKCIEAGFPMRELMGQTETSIILWASEKDLLERPGCVGRPVLHAEVQLQNADGVPVGPGEIGEIVVRGPVVMTGYWRNPELTSVVFRNGWLRTGDLARRDEEGFFFLVDRMRNMFISGGENVSTTEVEQVLEEHPGVREVAVVGVDDNVWGQTGCAFIVCADGVTLTQAELEAFCKERLARYKCPTRYVFLSALPLTSSGKVRKVELLEALQAS
jgi:fatty-acyl-CoA synthase